MLQKKKVQQQATAALPTTVQRQQEKVGSMEELKVSLA
jgi:hypothetical protein